MKTVFADFNAMTESGAIRLGCRGSQDDLRDRGIKMGDWMWLSDGELVVGAQLAHDKYAGIVGIPRWKTLVHLDDDDSNTFSAAWEHFVKLTAFSSLDPGQELRLFQLLTILAVIGLPSFWDSFPLGYFALRRAMALQSLGEPALALVEIEEVMASEPDDSDLVFAYLESLRMVDSGRAADEALRRAEPQTAAAPVLAACINIWSAVADQAPDDEFATFGTQILEWVARFERAPGRDRIRASILAQVQFNQGLTLLRMGRLGEARGALRLAHATNPIESAIDEASKLEVFDDRARKIAAGFRGKPPLIAA